MPARHIDDTRRRCLAFINYPKLLDRRPVSPSLRTRQNRNLAHVCPFACKSISKLSQARFSAGRRPSPEGYAETFASQSQKLNDVQRDTARQAIRSLAGLAKTRLDQVPIGYQRSAATRALQAYLSLIPSQ
jgi:hypothetical protein